MPFGSGVAHVLAAWSSDQTNSIHIDNIRGATNRVRFRDEVNDGDEYALAIANPSWFRLTVAWRGALVLPGRSPRRYAVGFGDRRFYRRRLSIISPPTASIAIDAGSGINGLLVFAPVVSM